MANSTTQTTEADLANHEFEALLDLIKNVNSHDTWEAQNILLRRLALQGDVIASRVPPPRNITEIGGYLNLLTKLNQQEMRSQVLAGILGVAGPNPPLGWNPSTPPRTIATLSNDRPPGPAQPSIPLTFSIRSDFAQAIQIALDSLHQLGCQLPLLSATKSLPALSTTATSQFDLFAYLGRTLQIMPGTALQNPATDPVALARLQGTANPFEIVCRSEAQGGGAPSVAPKNWDAIQCTATASTQVAVNASFVPIAPILAASGFYATSPLQMPHDLSSFDWTRLTNVTGLVAGLTKLGDELALLYRPAEIETSAFAPQLNWLWNGSQFTLP